MCLSTEGHLSVQWNASEFVAVYIGSTNSADSALGDVVKQIAVVLVVVASE